MTRVRDVMAKQLTVLAPEEDALRAMRTLLDRQLSGAPVVDAQGNLVGLLTQRDCLDIAYQVHYHGGAAGRVADHMTVEVETVSADMTLVDVIDRFRRSPHRRFPVLEDHRLVGQISRRDVLRATLELP